GIKVAVPFKDVASGWKEDRDILILAAREANRRGIPLVALTTNRFLRHRDFHTINNPHVLPTDEDYRQLRRCTEGAMLATISNPDGTNREQAKVLSNVGQEATGRTGGRPGPGYKKKRRLRDLPKAVEMRRQGHSIREIASELKRPPATIQG